MARRFNIDSDFDFALQGYGFENRLYEGYDTNFDLGHSLFSNVSALAFFSDDYSATNLSETPMSLNNDDNTLQDAPLQPSQPLNSTPFGATFELSSLLAANGGDGSAGFVINGIDGGGANSSGDGSGGSVSSAGDINGDGFDDFIIGAARADPSGNTNAGESYVIFGSASGLGASFDLSMLDGTNGFFVSGINSGDRSGSSVSSAGDINGDGFADIIIGAESSNNIAGESYIIFGSNAGFGASFNLSGLDGTNGFVINGIDPGDKSGVSVSAAGDINGDGIDDLIIGAENASPSGVNRAGESYVVFGTDNGFGTNLQLSSLNGTNGFVLTGIDESDSSGISVSSAGDINGDGFDDLIIGSRRADPNSSYSGESYIVFGSNAEFGASLDLSALDGGNGFVVNGIGFNDYSGGSVSSAGDINGDGFDDIIIGATQFGFYASENGEAYVVFGTASPFAATLELSSLNGTNGFAIKGIDFEDAAGSSVSSVGDINGDGFDDLIIGASAADPNGNSFSGESYIIYGKETGFGASLDLVSLDGTNGFVINGIAAGDRTGFSVSSAGDINNDGFDDVIIGARDASPNGNGSAGQSYVIYGQANSTFELSSLLAENGGDGGAGFVINGIDADDRSGTSVSSAGDINGDGFDDIIIGASHADPNGSRSGESYVVFGQAGSFGASLDLSALNGSNGFVINGIDGGDYSGRSVSSAGDINGDGFDDIIIGAYGADPNGGRSGESYVVFGQAGGFGASLDLTALNGSNGFVLNGIGGFDFSGRSVSSAGDINGDGFDDILIGANNGDPNGENSGESYVVFGQADGFGASFDLSTLDGTNGFVINGIERYDYSGNSVSSAGDINGDGFDDILIGAGDANVQSGQTYVVFGQATTFGSSLNLSALNGNNGFVINGVDIADFSGWSVSSAGDINGDGFDDILIGSADLDGLGDGYVVFGQAGGFAASFELSALNGTNGFTIINTTDVNSYSGVSVSSAGDINGDGFDDILIGAQGAGSSGESYVVFGQASGFVASLDLSTLDGINGFVVKGIDDGDFSGRVVSSAGDINSDGFDDILIAAERGDPNGNDSGESYVIYGSAEFGRIVETLTAIDDAYTASDSGEVVRGLAGDDVINGGAASDVLSGDEGNDTLNGNAGNDRLEGGTGDDTLDGGMGTDLAVYTGNTSDYDIVNNGDGTYTVTDNVGADGTDTLTNVEFLRFGDGEIDILTVTVFTEGDDVVDGTEGDDVLDALGGNDRVNGLGGNDTIFGRAGDDFLFGNEGNDILIGGAGGDSLFGGAGADELNGGDGIDYVYYSASDASVTVNLETGLGTGGHALGDVLIDIEHIYGSSTFGDVLTGNDLNNHMFGDGGDDLIAGGAGNDLLFAQSGDDTLQGDAGDDFLIGGEGNDNLDGGDGIDYAVFTTNQADYTITDNGDGTFTITDNVGTDGTDIVSNTEFARFADVDVELVVTPLFTEGADVVDGTEGDDVLDALGGNDVVNGLEGNDTIFGRAGNDLLSGDSGNDTLNGGDGADRLIGGEGADVLNGGAGFDSVDYRGATSGVRLNVVSGGTLGDAAGEQAAQRATRRVILILISKPSLALTLMIS